MRTLLLTVLALLFSANSSAGLIELSTDWRAGVLRVGDTEDYSQTFGGKLSYVYEEGSNLISSMIFFNEDDVALFSLLSPIRMEWPHFVGDVTPETARAWLGHEVDGHEPMRFIDLQSGEFLTMGITEMRAMTAAGGTSPTLDDFNGLIFGGLQNEDWGMSFYSGGNGVRAKVPEPATLGVLMAGILCLVGARLAGKTRRLPR